MKYDARKELRERAAQVIPGGMYGHMSINWRMPEGYPQFFSRADGCRLRDVDGNEYIDYMCAYGPMILGYGQPDVIDAAEAQRRQIDTATGPGPVIVELAAVTGREHVRTAASSIFATGSFWFQAAPMAAAIKTLDLLAEQNAPAYLERIGNLLRQGIYEQAQRHGQPVRQSGPVQMPLILFEGDKKSQKGNAFCASLIQQGVYMHPWHNMFLSTAHTEADIEKTLEATDIAFQAVPDL